MQTLTLPRTQALRDPGRMTGSAAEAEWEALLTRFLSILGQPDEVRAFITEHPETLSPQFDELMGHAAAFVRRERNMDEAALVDGHRELLKSCREMGVGPAFLKAHAQAVVGGLLDARGPDEKIAYLRAHPELDEWINRVALYQMIDRAQQEGDEEFVSFLRSNLMLIDLAFMTSPEEAVNSAYKRS
jgi:hypothetical protein